MTVLRISGWGQHFENNRTRELKSLDWVPIPNKQDGDGYTDLVEHPSGAAHFGAWIAIVEVASKCRPRGILVRDSGKPHDSRSLARVTRLKAEIFDEAIPRLLEIGWLETQDLADQQDTTEPNPIPQEDAAIPHQGEEKRLTNGTEGKGREGNDDERKSRVVVVLGAEGFKPDDPIINDPNCTPDQVAIAIANANAYPPDKLGDRKGYIAQAIRKGYKLSAKASRLVNAQKRKAESEAERKRDAEAARSLQDEAEEAKRVVMGMDDKRFSELAEMALDENPSIRSFVKVDKTQPWFQLKVYQLMRKEEAHATACN